MRVMPCCLPDQAVADEKGRVVRQVSLAIVDDQALFAKVVNVMRVAVAVVLFLLPLVGNRDRLEDRLATVLERLQVFLFESIGKVTQRFLAGFQVDLVGVGQGADIGQVQGLIQKTAEGWLGVPVVEGHRQLACRDGLSPTAAASLGDAQFAVVQIARTSGWLFCRRCHTPSR